jgi:WD40 repeat protein
MKMQTFVIGVVLLQGACSLAAPLPPGRPKERAVLEGHPAEQLKGLAFSPDGALIASTGNYDGTARVWEVASAKCIGTLRGHTTPPGSLHRNILAVAFSPDGKTLATCGLDENIKLWDTTSWNCTATLRGKDLPRKVAFSPDGKTFATSGINLCLWDLKAEKFRVLCKDCDLEQALAFDPKGKLLFASADPGGARSSWLPSFRIWDPETGKAAFEHEGTLQHKFNCLAFSPDGKTLATGSRDQPVKLWDVATGRNTLTYEDRLEEPASLVFSPNGKVLACGFSYLNRGSGAPPHHVAVRLYATATGKVLATLEGKTGPFYPLAFRPDGRLLATGDFDGKIILWQLPLAYQEEDAQGPTSPRAAD